MIPSWQEIRTDLAPTMRRAKVDDIDDASIWLHEMMKIAGTPAANDHAGLRQALEVLRVLAALLRALRPQLIELNTRTGPRRTLLGFALSVRSTKGYALNVLTYDASTQVWGVGPFAEHAAQIAPEEWAVAEIRLPLRPHPAERVSGSVIEGGVS